MVYSMNEIDGMKSVMPKIKKEWYDQLLIIDGGSTDGTLEYARAQGYEVYRQAGHHWVGAYEEAYRRATGDILIDFSPDGNSVPEAIPELVKKIKEGYDMVIASRYMRGAKSEDDTLVTGFGNWIITQTMNLLFGAHYTDSIVMYRAYTRQMLKALGLNETINQAPTAQLSVRAAKYKMRVAEIPADEPKRIGGKRKMKILEDGFNILKLMLRELVTPVSRN
ncbi:MAG: glycosyltransferase family 2 protein [Candidatus Omnitrophica bacterium]|nr:glycosyltransferase family 2 protein [Candidatus Omnitrophota bacterium]